MFKLKFLEPLGGKLSKVCLRYGVPATFPFRRYGIERSMHIIPAECPEIRPEHFLRGRSAAKINNLPSVHRQYPVSHVPLPESALRERNGAKAILAPVFSPAGGFPELSSLPFRQKLSLHKLRIKCRPRFADQFRFCLTNDITGFKIIPDSGIIAILRAP